MSETPERVVLDLSDAEQVQRAAAIVEGARRSLGIDADAEVEARAIDLAGEILADQQAQEDAVQAEILQANMITAAADAEAADLRYQLATMNEQNAKRTAAEIRRDPFNHPAATTEDRLDAWRRQSGYLPGERDAEGRTGGSRVVVRDLSVPVEEDSAELTTDQLLARWRQLYG